MGQTEYFSFVVENMTTKNRGRMVTPVQAVRKKGVRLESTKGKALPKGGRSPIRVRSKSRSNSPVRNTTNSGSSNKKAASQVLPILDNSARSDRELFVGNTPTSAEVTDSILQDFLNDAMRKVGLVNYSQTPIIQCKISNKSKFSFIEFDSAEHCSKGLYLNGIPFMGSMLKIGRPSKYSGPTEENVSWQQISGTEALPKKDITAYYNQNTKSYREIFAGNIADSVTEADLTEFIGNAMIRLGFTGSYSDIDQVDDIQSPVLLTRISGKFSFIEMKSAEDACNLLNLDGIPFMGSSLKLSRPSKFDGYIEEEGGGGGGSGSGKMDFYSWPECFAAWTAGKLRLLTAGEPSNVVMITNMATNAELVDPLVYFELIGDTRAECSSHGRVISVIVPRVAPTLLPQTGDEGADQADIAARVRGIAKVFVEMATVEEASQVILAVKGRTYNRRFVDMKFYPTDYFQAMNYSYCPPHLVISATRKPVTIEKVLNQKTIAKLFQPRR